MKSNVLIAALVCTAGVSLPVHAGVTYQTQSRAISVATSFDGNQQSAAAPDFGRFQASLTLATDFINADGATQDNTAGAGIDCQLDPNAILVNGSLSGAGGLALTGGKAITGEAAVSLSIEFTLDQATSFALRASRRPSDSDKDRFKIKLEHTGGMVVMIDQDDPAQELDLEGVLPAGVYSLEYQAELKIEGPETLRDYFFSLAVPAPGMIAWTPAAACAALRRRRAHG
ncbi:MAG TPA: hypothetical protein VK176_04005 [Phycisphaerales bacterium]|nr:hypothetical protein [Phycisphaerales bacterium]